jgi:CDP-glucose 4,6-dehydratase
MVMESQFGDFFRSKTVLITGHTGFMGSWLAIWLKELGANVIGYSLAPNTNNDNYVVTKLDEKIISIIGEIRNFEKVNEVLSKYKPDITFHLAAQPLVRRSYRLPKETFDINVGGTVNIFEAFRLEEQSRILINITTDKCYENQESSEGYCEEDKLGGYEPYSSSKVCSELVTGAYEKSFFNETPQNNPKAVASVRSGNIIGGGDWQEDRLIPDCITAIKNNRPIIIRNPKAIRPWQFVLEPLRGYLMLAQKMWDDNEKYSGAWNFGPNRNDIFSVEVIVKKIIQNIGKGSYEIQSQEDSDNLHETEVLILNSTKSNKYLQWKPVLNIDETIEFITEWYFGKNIDYQFDVYQINKFIEKINK